MKPSQIFREAARRFETETNFHDGACDELCEIHHDGFPYALKETCLSDVFSLIEPITRYDERPWWWKRGKPGDDARIIGLCLAAAIAESEGQ